MKTRMLDPISRVRGDTIPLTLDEIKNHEGEAVESLVGWKCRFTVRDRTGIVVEKSTEATGTDRINVVGAAFTWAITPVESAHFVPLVSYRFDVEITDPAGRVGTPVLGSFVFEADESLYVS